MGPSGSSNHQSSVQLATSWSRIREKQPRNQHNGCSTTGATWQVEHYGRSLTGVARRAQRGECCMKDEAEQAQHGERYIKRATLRMQQNGPNRSMETSQGTHGERYMDATIWMLHGEFIAANGTSAGQQYAHIPAGATIRTQHGRRSTTGAAVRQEQHRMGQQYGPIMPGAAWRVQHDTYSITWAT